MVCFAFAYLLVAVEHGHQSLQGKLDVPGGEAPGGDDVLGGGRHVEALILFASEGKLFC